MYTILQTKKLFVLELSIIQAVKIVIMPSSDVKI